MKDVFLSHSSRDAELALKVLRALEEAGVSCWIAPRDVTAGANFVREIRRAITDSRLVIALLTRESVSGEGRSPGWVERELHYADEVQRPILPLRIDQAPVAESDLGFSLSRIHYLDLPREPGEADLAAVVSAVRRLLQTPAEDTGTATPGLPVAERPQKRLGSRGIGLSIAALLTVAAVWVTQSADSGLHATMPQRAGVGASLPARPEGAGSAAPPVPKTTSEVLDASEPGLVELRRVTAPEQKVNPEAGLSSHTQFFFRVQSPETRYAVLLYVSNEEVVRLYPPRGAWIVEGGSPADLPPLGGDIVLELDDEPGAEHMLLLLSEHEIGEANGTLAKVLRELKDEGAWPSHWPIPPEVAGSKTDAREARRSEDTRSVLVRRVKAVPKSGRAIDPGRVSAQFITLQHWS